MHFSNILTLLSVLVIGYSSAERRKRAIQRGYRQHAPDAVFDIYVSLLHGSSSGVRIEAQALGCPAVRTTSGWLDLFPLPCKKNSECLVMGTLHLCCKGFCTKGVVTSSPLKRPSESTSSVIVTSSSSTSTTIATTTTISTTTIPPSTTTTSTTPRSTTSAPTTTTTTTTTTQKPTTTTTQAALPFLQLLPIQIQATPATTTAKPAKISKSQKFVCPKPGQAPVILFPILCQKNSQCRATNGPDHVCCEGRCVKGVPAPRPTSPPKPHQPLLGVIPRECPSTPLGELLFEVQTCKNDADCWPRICCPDGARSYCRTAHARLDLVPVANRIEAPVRMLEQYLQCTPPPEYDLFPQKCNSSVDCFPNLCCAEGGKKHCRPPQRSLLALLAGVGQRVGSSLMSLRQAQANNS